MIVAVYACNGDRDPGSYWYEVETQPDHDKPEIIHTDGMFDSVLDAIEAGEAWARENGHDIGTMPEGDS